MKDPIKMITECMEMNEPTFTVRAKDMFSLIAVQSYDIAVQRNCVLSDEFKDEIHKICEDFVEWRFKYKEQVKLPD